MPSQIALSSPFVGLQGPIVPGFFAVDELSLAFLVCLTVLGVLLLLCAPATSSVFRHVMTLLFFFLGSVGIITAVNVITFFGAWEICSLFAWAVSQLASDNDQLGDGVIPFQAAGALGSFAMLFGLILLATSNHSLFLKPASTSTPAVVPLLLLLAITLKSYALLSDAWNDRVGHRFNLAGATLAGLGLLTIGMYPFFRLFGPVLGNLSNWRETTFWVAAILAVLSALAALGESDFRRALAHGAFSQFWLMILVFTVGTRPAVLGAIVGSVADAFAFTGLFLCLSAAEEATAQVLLRRVGGLAQRLPVTAALFIVCAVSVIGLPPLTGFMADGLIGAATFGSDSILGVWMIIAGLTLVYLVHLFATLFLGEMRGPVHSERRLPLVVVSGGVVGALLMFGTLATNLLGLLDPVARQLLQ